MDLLYLRDQRIRDVLRIDNKDVLDDGPGSYFNSKRPGRNSSSAGTTSHEALWLEPGRYTGRLSL